MFGRQGYPFSLFRQGTSATLGADSTQQVLVTPAIDDFRYPNPWDTDLRAARTLKASTVNVRAILDAFYVYKREHRAGTEQQHRVAVLQRAGAEPEPADFPLGVVVGS